MLFWAGNSIVGRAVRDDIPPFTLAFVRWTGALLVLAPLAWRHTISEWNLVRSNWPVILLLGLVGVAAFNGFLYSGLHYTTASNALLIQALIPALVLLGGAMLFGDRAPLGQIVGVALSTLGVMAIVFRGDPMAILGLHFGFGDSLILCGCLAWAIYTVCLRLAPPVHSLTFLFLTFMIGALAMAPLAMSEANEIAEIPLKPGIFAAFAYVAVLPSVCAYFLFNGAVARIGSGAAGQTISLMPLFGALLASVLLDEELVSYHAVGMTLILTGVMLSALTISRRAR
jgi:drug/metabolite transporter (DMT)-like permease